MRDPATKEEFLQSLRAKQQRATLAPYWVLAALILGVGLALFAAKVYAEPLFSTINEGATITLTNDKCDLKEISNLPYKATWVEKDKSYLGCWGARPDIGMVLAYFDDKTIALIPIEVFKRVTGV